MKKRVGGRPKIKPEAGNRVHVGFRVTPDIKQRLQEAATRSGRSLSQEAEFRLERSFAEDAALGGPSMRMLAMEMVATFHNRGSRQQSDDPKEWMTQVEPYTNAMIGVFDVLMRNHPNDQAEYTQAAIEHYFRPYYWKKSNKGGFIEPR